MYYLRDPFKSFLVESEWLLNCFVNSLEQLKSASDRKNRYALSAEMSVISLHDSWCRFCREVVIMSAGCRPFTTAGARLPLATGIYKRADVIPMYLSTFKKKRYEPRWGNSVECVDAAQRLNISNFSTFSASIGASNSTAEEIRVVRNYYAHRNKGTASKIRDLGTYSGTVNLAVQYTAGQVVTPGIVRMESWVNNLRIIAGAAVE